MNHVEVVFVEYLDEKGLRAEIYYLSQQWAELYEKRGKIHLSIFFDTNNEYKIFPYIEMMKLLEDTKTKLLIKKNTRGVAAKNTTADAELYNTEAEKILERILNCSSKKIIQGTLYRFGKIVDHIAPGIGGARYSEAGEFIGFLEV